MTGGGADSEEGIEGDSDGIELLSEGGVVEGLSSKGIEVVLLG
jgi:hypothetical protein